MKLIWCSNDVSEDECEDECFTFSGNALHQSKYLKKLKVKRESTSMPRYVTEDEAK